MDQRLRLAVEVKDAATPKLKGIAKELKEIKRTPTTTRSYHVVTGHPSGER